MARKKAKQATPFEWPLSLADHPNERVRWNVARSRMRREVPAILARRFLRPEDAITEISERPDALLLAVKTRCGSSWCVEDVPRVNGVPRSAGYSLYLFDDDGVIAALPDERTFRLGEERELLAFIQAARAILSPLEIAGHAAHRLSKVGGESLLTAGEQMIPFLTKAQIEALPITLPEVEPRSDGSLRLSFCTFFTDHRTDPYWTISLNRWRVEVDAEGRLTREVKPLARGLDSAFYRPR